MKQHGIGHESNDECVDQSKEAAASKEMDHMERLERHCLPALQLLQLDDDDDEDDGGGQDEALDIKPVVPLDQADRSAVESTPQSAEPAVKSEPPQESALEQHHQKEGYHL